MSNSSDHSSSDHSSDYSSDHEELSFGQDCDAKQLYHKLKRKQKKIERKYKVTYLKN